MFLEEEDGREVGGHGVHVSPWISGIHLQTQKCLQSTSQEWAGIPDHQKRLYRTM